MGNCTHKPTKTQNNKNNRPGLKLKTNTKQNGCVRSDSEIFEDMTPDRKPQNGGIIPKKSQFKPNKNVQESQQEDQNIITNTNSNTTPSHQTKSTDFHQERTTASRQNIRENYRLHKVIGEGSFGKVRLASNFNGKKFAIKSIIKADAEERFYLLRRELDIMKKVDHPNLVKFYETYHDDKYLHIVMEYVEGVELSTFCQERFDVNRRFTEIEVAYIVRKLLSALSHMHSLNIIHRDIKPENIMINESNLDIKILDFGLSRDFTQTGTSKLQSIVGTPLYVAPEVINETPYNEKCDVWSMGVLMYYLLSGQQAFEASSIKDLFKQICMGNFNFNSRVWNDISQDAKTLITQLLTVDPYKRISCEQALQSPWFSLLLRRQLTQKSRNMKKCLSKIHNVIAFQNSHKFKQEIIRIMFNTQTQSDEIEKLKMAFETIDSDDNGYISAEEMYKATQILKIPITIQQIYSLFQDINSNKINSAFRNSDELDINIDDTKHQNRIHYSDFVFAAINLSKELDQGKIRQLFDQFDKDNDNFISVSDLENTLAQEGRKLPQIAIKQMIEEVDNDGDGKISFQEFTQLIQTEIEVFQKTRTSFTNLEI